MSIECGAPFLLDGDREFAVISIQGQSFMLHQIRKMIGLVISVAKGYTTDDIFDDAFKTVRVSTSGEFRIPAGVTTKGFLYLLQLDIPKAPGLGLLLDQVCFTRYNNRFCADGSHQAIDWERYKVGAQVLIPLHILRYHWVTKFRLCLTAGV